MPEWLLLSPGGASEVTLAEIRDRLNGTLDAAITGEVSLDAATLAALEQVTVTVDNLPGDYPDAATLAAVQAVESAIAALVAPQTDALTDDELRAADVDVADSGEREYTHVVATVTSSGDTVVYTPAVGKAVRLRWIYAINDPTALSAPLIKVRLGAEEKYRAWAISKRQRVTGPIDGALTINLTGSGTVAVTALLEEI